MLHFAQSLYDEQTTVIYMIKKIVSLIWYEIIFISAECAAVLFLPGKTCCCFHSITQTPQLNARVLTNILTYRLHILQR